MRNPKLSIKYVVALLETSSDELGLPRREHADILSAAATNPDIIESSRRTGRGVWVVDGDANSPFEEFGQMWKLSVEKWIDEARVVYGFLKYVQTTPTVKLETYNALLSDTTNEAMWLRQEVIRSCDPIEDCSVLKAAWDDPAKECRKLAVERVG